MAAKEQDFLSNETVSAAVSQHSPLVATCCSATKRRSPVLLGRDAAVHPSGIASAWLTLINAAEPVVRADELYAGRAFSTVRSASVRHRFDMGVVSAGLGFVLGRTVVPSYSLTLGEGPDSLRTCAPRTDVREWWSALSPSRFAADLVEEVRKRPVTVIALTQRYAAMLAETLERLGNDIGRLRLIGLGLRRVVPSTVASSILPYDLRAVSALGGGTMGEFAARATAFHLDAWAGQRWDLDREREHAAAISAAGVAPAPPTRRRATDAEIIEGIVRAGAGASAAVALRRLRQEGIACGSGRIARIMAVGAET